MLDIYLLKEKDEFEKNDLNPQLSLGGATYWFLHRYFVHADLNPGSYDFLNQYEDTELKGYQLHRLKCELKEALLDLSVRPSTFKVLVGWEGTQETRDSEMWGTIEKENMIKITEQFLALIEEALEKDMILFAFGD